MVERSDYNGKPILVLRRSEDDKFPFSFGIAKAKLILENLEEIKKFVEENTPKE
jgi:hypothetical protein